MEIEVYNSADGAAFFQRLLTEWRIAGAGVTAHSSVSESDYRVNRGRFGRLVLRWRMYAGQGWVCWRATRREGARAPVRIVTTNPFFAPALVARVTRGRGATINLLYDLFPEALIHARTVAPNSWVARRCAAITRFALRECTATVFLGDRLRAHAETTYGPARRAVVIPVGADGAPFRSAPPQLLPEAEKPRILYSGQMGRMHDWTTVAGAWTAPAETGVTWAFHASGAGYAQLRQATDAGSAGVTWGAPLPDAEWREAMTQAQVAFVTIAPGAEQVVMPSKTYSALVAGQAILAVCRRSSDLADLVIRHDCGWVVEPGDCAGLRQAIRRIAHDPAGLWVKRKNSFAAGHRYYDMTAIAAGWMKLFEELGNQEPASLPGRAGPAAA
jgi:glycosyltransferase involved in cell wall biosynthesis